MIDKYSRGELGPVQSNSSQSRAVNQRLITFRVSQRPQEMYCGHAHLCVCRSAAACPHYCTDLDVTWGVVGDAP